MTWSTLHDLCSRLPTPFATAAIVKYAREVPNEIAFVDDRGYTPLHVAVTLRYDPPLEVIKALVDLNPNVVMAKDLHGDTPMHLALRPCASTDLIRTLLHACPNFARQPNKEGLLPIHAACRFCCDKEEIISLLLEANPSALRSRTKMGNLVQRKKLVSEIVPHASFTKGNQHLILDGTTSSSWRSSQIMTSTETHFEERSIQLREGFFPLHMAVANGAPLRIIEMLIMAAPDVLSLTDKFQRTCLHLAVANGATIDSCLSMDPENSQIGQRPKTTIKVIELLHSMDKSLIARTDNRKNFPLHTAVQGGCSAGCVQYLIGALPQAIHARNDDGLTPLEVALKFGTCSKQVTIELGQEVLNCLSEL